MWIRSYHLKLVFFNKNLITCSGILYLCLTKPSSWCYSDISFRCLIRQERLPIKICPNGTKSCGNTETPYHVQLWQTRQMVSFSVKGIFIMKLLQIHYLLHHNPLLIFLQTKIFISAFISAFCKYFWRNHHLSVWSFFKCYDSKCVKAKNIVLHIVLGILVFFDLTGSKKNCFVNVKR